MKCSQHYDRDAVAHCVDCGRALCPECTNKWSIPICDTCNYNRAGNDKNQVVKNIALMVPLFILGFWIVPPQGSFVLKFMFGYLLAGLPWGWNFLNRITPNIFLILPIFGWVIYFIIKFSIALCIGEFVLPYKIFTLYKSYKNAKVIQENINNSIS